MFLYWLLNAQRLPYWFATRGLAACRTISTAQVVVLGPLLILMLILPAVLVPGGNVTSTSNAREPNLPRSPEAAQAEIERRWLLRQFYASTIYKQGSFPRAGFYHADGTPWTPEVGGPCFDALRRRRRPERDFDPNFCNPNSTTGSMERGYAP